MPYKPKEPDNVVWQTRTRAPSAYELALVHALETVMSDGTHDLAGIVAGLNRQGFRMEDGAAWTEPAFTAELKRLAA